MPSFQDSAIIVFLALLLFGPKKLPELARQLGKLMAEFRRASNEFRMQMEEELRVADQAEQQKKLAAIEAAAPKPAAIESSTSSPVENTSDSGYENPTESFHENTIAPPIGETEPAQAETFPSPVPIATSGDLNLMPPSTGLPEPRSTTRHEAAEETTTEASQHG